MRTEAGSSVAAAFLAVAALATAGPAGAAPSASAPVEARAAPTVADDPMEFHVVISTQGAQRSRSGLLRRPVNDIQLRAVVERATGAVSFEVRKTINYYDLQARNFRSVHYATADGLERAELTPVRRTASACAAADLPAACVMREELAFPVDEAVLREVAGAPDGGSPAHWRLRFKAARGEDVDSAVAASEIARLLAALDHYQGRAATVGGS